MFYHLFYPMREAVGAFNVFQYITFRTAMATLTALLVSLLLGPRLITRLQQFQIGQEIRKEGREPTGKNADAMHQEAHKILTKQLGQYKELLEDRTMGPTTPADVNIKMTNNHGNKDEPKPPCIREMPLKNPEAHPDVLSLFRLW